MTKINNTIDVLKNDWRTLDLQNKILEILEYFSNFCCSHNIAYSLAYGTVLGSIRHNGFIPWDDDADVYLMFDDYLLFKKAFECEGDKNRFVLQELFSSDGVVTSAKLRIRGTTFIEPSFRNLDVFQGIYIDIFMLFNAPCTVFKKIKMNFANQLLTLIELGERDYSFKGKRKYKFFLRLIPKKIVKMKCFSLIKKYNIKYRNSSICFDPDLRTFKKSFYPKNIVFPTCSHVFCNKLFQIPNQYEKYLENSYGEYMKIPSFESILKGRHSVFYDTNIDYYDYKEHSK